MGCKGLISSFFHRSYWSFSGRFRWVYCQLDYLATCLPGRVRHALDELPVTLDETYERTLNEIGDTNWEFARRLIQCVAVVSRPLKVEELAEFLAFDFSMGQIPTFREDWRLEDPAEAVLSTCSTLLSIVNIENPFNFENSQVIQFSHFSVKEFLTSVRFGDKCNIISTRYHVSMTPAHILVAQTCLGILLHLDKNITKATLPNFPLAEYAAEHWFKHARFKAVSQNVGEGMKQLFDRKKHHLATWLWIFDPTVISRERDRSMETPQTPDGTPLHYAAFCGLSDAVNFLAVEHSEDVNSRSFIGGETPLHLGSRAGHVDVAQLLIEHGADVVAQDEYGSTPLHQASKGGGVDLPRLLIQHGAKAAAQNEHGWTPLHMASSWGHVDLARLLIQHGADAGVKDEDGETPLHQASSGGHVDLARLLIDHGADAAAQDEYGLTPLHQAYSGSHVDLIRLLITHGADVTAQNEGSTLLHQASSGGHVDLTRLLIEHGRDLATKNKCGFTPLYQASSRGDLELSRLFLERGADVAARDIRGLTPLHGASSGGHIDLALLLIDHGADVAAQDENGWTPLHQASSVGHVDLARLLIQHGADAAAQDEVGETPLHQASSGGHVDLAQLLIDQGADAAAQDEYGLTPLHQAFDGGHIDLARLLISMEPQHPIFSGPDEWPE